MRTDAIRLTPKQQALLRRQAVRLRERGQSNAEVARILRVHAKTVSGWWAAYNRIGVALFEPGKRGRRRGDQRKLTAEREREVQRLITERLPDWLKLPFALWSRSAVGELIELRYGIRLAVRTLGEYLRRWGYTPTSPQTRARERADRVMRTWLDQTYPGIVSQAGREGALLCWGDQIGVNGEPTVPPGALSYGDANELRQTAARITLSMIRAVTNRGAVRFLIYTGVLNAAVLVRFCGRLVASAEGRAVYLILDHLPIHNARAFKQWIDDHHQQFTVYYLPT